MFPDAPHNQSEQPQNYSRFKFLNEIEPNLSPTNTKKNVSFSNTDVVNTFTTEPEHDEEDINIFLKLKKVNKKEDNIKLEIHEPTINDKNLNEDRIAKLERNMLNLNEKMDKIIALLSQQN